MSKPDYLEIVHDPDLSRPYFVKAREGENAGAASCRTLKQAKAVRDYLYSIAATLDGLKAAIDERYGEIKRTVRTLAESEDTDIGPDARYQVEYSGGIKPWRVINLIPGGYKRDEISRFPTKRGAVVYAEELNRMKEPVTA